MEEDPKYSTRLDDQLDRENEFLSRRLEAGDPDAAAKRARLGVPETVELEQSPAVPSETRHEHVQSEGGLSHSRAPSTVTMYSDIVAPDLPTPTDADVVRRPISQPSLRARSDHLRDPLVMMIVLKIQPTRRKLGCLKPRRS